jgi:hypothetical protein
VIFGGDHADLPLGAVHGEAIADIVATSNTPAIIDTSLMRVVERTRFFTDFASELLRKNKGPLHLFIDECHLMMPQGRVADPQSGNMLHAANNLISLGRSKGLRVTLISQRPAKVHKDALTQIETMIAMRLIAPQDRHAVEDWIADQADQQKGRDIIASLPSLAKGQGWVWAPELGILKKVTFPRIKTFDSGRTPEGFGAGDGPVLAAIDMATISTKLVAIKEEADANDPAKLKAKIRELEKRASAPATTDPGDLVRAKDDGYPTGKVDGYSAGVRETAETTIKEIEAAILQAVAGAMAKVTRQTGKHAAAAAKRVTIVPGITRGPSVKASRAGVQVSGELTGPQQKIVDSLAFWLGIAQTTPNRQQVAAVAGYSPKSGGFKNLLGQLHSIGIIGYPSPGILTLVETSGAQVMDGETAKNKLLGSLTAPERKVLAAFNGTAASRGEIAERSGYSPSSGGFNNLLGSLSSIGVVTRPAPGMVDLADWVRELL